MTSRLLIGAVIGIGLSGPALAQSFTAPAGIPTVTAPGGLQGRATPADLRTAPDGRAGVQDADGRPASAIGTVDPRRPHPAR
ncbi:hypothetical protein ACU4GR_10225 (plasmid) [Methylobacterium oryzae CBMB20]